MLKVDRMDDESTYRKRKHDSSSERYSSSRSNVRRRKSNEYYESKRSREEYDDRRRRSGGRSRSRSRSGSIERSSRRHRSPIEDRERNYSNERKDSRREERQSRKEEESYKKEVEQELEKKQMVEETEEEKRLKRLQRRQAILAKYQTDASPPTEISKQATDNDGETKIEQQKEPVQTDELPQSGNDQDTKKEEASWDMFSSDVDVIPVEVRSIEGEELKNDREGYYCPRMGEILGDKYRVLATYGKGVFSVVVKASNLATEEIVAIKMVRNNDLMKSVGKKEIQILTQLLDTTTNNCCIQIKDSFEDRGHLCIVFEPMAYNLRELLKKYGKGVGLALDAVKYYARCMFVALSTLAKYGTMHADIKPDNILVRIFHLPLFELPHRLDWPVLQSWQSTERLDLIFMAKVLFLKLTGRRDHNCVQACGLW